MTRKHFLSGLMTLLPIFVTLWVMRFIFSALINLFRPPTAWVANLLGIGVPHWVLGGISLVASVLVIFLVGLLMGNFMGRQLLAWVDDLMMSIPGIKRIYGATKQLMNAIQSGQEGSFKEVVLVEWPHPGSQTLGFLARTDCSWAMPGGESKIAIYIPTAPNPTSGYVVMVDQDKVQKVNISPEQAFTWVVSGGVVTPQKSEEGI